MSYIKFWMVLISVMLAAWAILGVVSSYKQPLTHYIGQTDITPEQYILMDSLDEPPKRKSSPFSYLIKNPDGTLTFYYDFYSSKAIGFLNKTNGGLMDNRVYHTFVSSIVATLADGYFAVLLAVLSLAYLLLIWKGRQLIKWSSSFVRRLEKQVDRQYPMVDSQYISKTLNLDYGDGILCVRSWRVNKGQLKSVARETNWKDSQLTSPKNPSANNMSGIHGYRLGSVVGQKSTVMGIVELRGKYEYHPDGVVRAENCKIRGLFISKGYQKLGRVLANKYRVPLMFDNSPTEGYLHWLYSENGQKGLQHNFELLKG